MNRNAVVTVLITAMLAISLVAAAGVGASSTESSATTQSETYAGSHLEFEASGSALTNYAVGGETVFSSVAVDSQSNAGVGGGAGIDLGTVVSLEGAGLSVSAESQTKTRIESESGATLSAHDNERGILVVRAGGDAQVVEAQLGENVQASAEGDGERVFVEGDERNGVFLVIGDGDVTVNEEGNVAASLEGESTLVFRSYADGERTDETKSQEQLIADGSAAAEVYVEQRDGETVADAVTYGEDLTLEAKQEGERRVDVTVDRAIEEGTIVMTTVEEETVGTLEDLEVRVDGEAAAQASSHSELESAIGGEESAYMVSQHAEAEATATVYVAFNHFSERTASIDGSGADDGSSDDDTGSSAESDGLPGFGALGALLGLLGTGVVARLRR
ncbi:PGF-CTERM sorting domain-containing protein [Natronosalvus halobius]|uniref:PGF-CTERM sorting domain-containing protein n=1 Tax=Natronosalvus halobius TaxID=2953746 RepID=UPI0020A175BF|nr:PGF-CTERM sorting domain-containing protein [Natronosalvus halobius]USZ71561.1 PGF-CTERM sorting domain-containing protein [Natronosalvus halobius]